MRRVTKARLALWSVEPFCFRLRKGRKDFRKRLALLSILPSPNIPSFLNSRTKHRVKIIMADTTPSETTSKNGEISRHF
jgi:hypothetical protein